MIALIMNISIFHQLGRSVPETVASLVILGTSSYLLTKTACTGRDVSQGPWCLLLQIEIQQHVCV